MMRGPLPLSSRVRLFQRTSPLWKKHIVRLGGNGLFSCVFDGAVLHVYEPAELHFGNERDSRLVCSTSLDVDI
jgi:hypothetical protein